MEQPTSQQPPSQQLTAECDAEIVTVSPPPSQDEQSTSKQKKKKVNLPIIYSYVFRVFYWLRFLVIIAWVVGACVAVSAAFEFGDRTTSDLKPPSGSDSAAAQDALETYFPSTAESDSLSILFRCETVNCTVDKGPWFRQAVDNITTLLADYKIAEPSDADHVQAFVTIFTVINNYSAALPADLSAARGAFISASGRASMGTISLKKTKVKEEKLLIKYLRNKLPTVDLQQGNYSLYMAGTATFNVDNDAATTSDTELMEFVALPIALLILVFVVQSVVLVLIPICVVVVTYCISFGVMAAVADSISVPPFIASVMTSLLIATAVDYSLFILTRYREELNKGRDNYASVAYTLLYSGETVVISGSVLVICFGALYFFPVEMVQCIGYSATITVFTSMAVSITLTPSLLLTFGFIFSLPGIIPGLPFSRIKALFNKSKARRSTTSPVTTVSSYELPKTPPEVVLSPNGHKDATIANSIRAIGEKLGQMTTEGMWMKYSWITTHRWLSIAVFVVILVILLPFTAGLSKFNLVANDMQNSPDDSDTVRAQKVMDLDYTAGQIYSYTLLAVAKDPATHSVWSEEYFNISHQLAAELTASEFLCTACVQSISYLDSSPVDWSLATVYLTASKFFGFFYTINTNTEATATLWTLYPTINPNADPNGIPETVRPIIDKFSDAGPFKFHMYSLRTTIYDSVEDTMDLLPIILVIMAVVIVVVIGVVFRSVVLPFRMVATIALVIIWAFSVMSIVFCSDAFWDVAPVIKEQPDIQWIIPMLAFFLIGVGLDYDIFLYNRVLEYRNKGYDNRSAIRKGMSKSCAVVIWAGIVMAIAFGGLIFSAELTLRQLGTLFTIAVLMDTVIVCSTFAPSCLAILGPLNYWPLRPKVKWTDPNEGEDKEEDTIITDWKPLFPTPAFITKITSKFSFLNRLYSQQKQQEKGDETASVEMQACVVAATSPASAEPCAATTPSVTSS